MEWRFAGRVDVILLCTWCEESRKKVVFGQREDKDRGTAKGRRCLQAEDHVDMLHHFCPKRA